MFSTVKYNFKGKIVVITGAERGIGLEIAVGFAKSGADIVIMSIHKTLPALTQTGVMCVSGDIVDYKKIKKY